MSKRQRARRDERRKRSGGRRVASGAGLALGVAMAAPAVGHASAPNLTVTVGTLSDSSGASDCATATNTDCSLRDAITAVNSDASDDPTAPDQVVFRSGLSGTIDLGSQLPTVTKPVAINGPGAGTVAVSGQGAQGILQVGMSSTSDPIGISGLTLEDGFSSSHDGAAVDATEGAVTITNSTLSGNHAQSHPAGAIYAKDSLAISNSTLSGNVTSQGGGAIYNKGALTVSDSTLSDNSASSGGAIYTTSAGSDSISGSTFEFDKAGSGGGAIYSYGALSISGSTLNSNYASYEGAIYADGALDISGTTISDNSAYHDFGGIFADSNAAKSITDSTITHNGAASDGGGLLGGPATLSGDTISANHAYIGSAGGLVLATYGTGSGAPIVTNSTVSGNSAARGGGGLYVYDGTSSGAASNVSLESVTVAGNSAARGGGILSAARVNGGAVPSLSNTIVAGNSASGGVSGAGADLDLVPGTSGAFSTRFSLIQSAPAGSFTADSSDVIGKDPQLGPLASNGGPTQTMALGSSSPALDQGSSPDTTDQRGFRRPVDLASVPNSGSPGANGADIGAFEVQSLPVQPVIPPAPAAQLSVSGPLHFGPNGVSFKLHCSSATCSGVATLGTVERVKNGRVVSLLAAKVRKRKVTVGSRSFSIAAGQTITVTVPLDRTGKLLLKRFGRLPVRLTVDLNEAGGKKVVVKSAKSVIKPKRHHKRKH